MTAYDTNQNESSFSGEVQVEIKDAHNNSMPDEWQINNGHNPTINDAAEAPGGDDFSNIRKYLAGTDPSGFNSSPKCIVSASMPSILSLMIKRY